MIGRARPRRSGASSVVFRGLDDRPFQVGLLPRGRQPERLGDPGRFFPFLFASPLFPDRLLALQLLERLPRLLSGHSVLAFAGRRDLRSDPGLRLFGVHPPRPADLADEQLPRLEVDAPLAVRQAGAYSRLLVARSVPDDLGEIGRPAARELGLALLDALRPRTIPMRRSRPERLADALELGAVGDGPQPTGRVVERQRHAQTGGEVDDHTILLFLPDAELPEGHHSADSVGRVDDRVADSNLWTCIGHRAPHDSVTNA